MRSIKNVKRRGVGRIRYSLLPADPNKILSSPSSQEHRCLGWPRSDALPWKSRPSVPVTNSTTWFRALKYSLGNSGSELHLNINPSKVAVLPGTDWINWLWMWSLPFSAWNFQRSFMYLIFIKRSFKTPGSLALLTEETLIKRYLKWWWTCNYVFICLILCVDVLWLNYIAVEFLKPL